MRCANGALACVTGDDTRWGGTVGVGLEYGFAPNWSVGVEYNHLFMQDRTYTFTTPGGVFFGTDRIGQDIDLVTARLNYKFGGPVVGSTDFRATATTIIEAPGPARGFFRWDARLTIGKSRQTPAFGNA